MPPAQVFFRLTGNTCGGNMRILVVEDDRKLARQLQKGLDESGHTTTVAFDGREGLEAAQAAEWRFIYENDSHVRRRAVGRRG